MKTSIVMNPPTPSQQLADVLAAEIPEGRIARVLSEAMAATLTTRAGAVEVDHKTRVAATTLVLAYKVGRPVERQEIVSVNLDADDPIRQRDRLRKSPALRRSLARMIDEVESETTA